MLGVALQGWEKNDEAGESFQRALDIDPAFEEAYFNFGVLIRESQPDRAQALFLRRLSVNPTTRMPTESLVT
jgi:tetratricopeptide (TPR) repeat protein